MVNYGQPFSTAEAARWSNAKADVAVQTLEAKMFSAHAAETGKKCPEVLDVTVRWCLWQVVPVICRIHTPGTPRASHLRAGWLVGWRGLSSYILVELPDLSSTSPAVWWMFTEKAPLTAGSTCCRLPLREVSLSIWGSPHQETFRQVAGVFETAQNGTLVIAQLQLIGYPH